MPAGQKTRLVKDDIVQVMTGRGRVAKLQGRILEIDRKKGRVLVEGARIVKKHVRPNPQKQIKGGIAESEAFFDISNVMIVCPKCGPVRIGVEMDGDQKTRVCRKCGETLDKKKRVR